MNTTPITPDSSPKVDPPSQPSHKSTHGLQDAVRFSPDHKARRRKREAIRRKYEYDTANLTAGKPDPSLLRSPKVIFGILVVMFVVGSLVVNTPKPQMGVDRSRLRMARSVEALAIATGLYHAHTRQWPTILIDLARRPADTLDWQGPYINWSYDDYWGTPYQYTRRPNQTPDIRSCGPDGIANTEDDIVAPDSAFIPSLSLLQTERPRGDFSIRH